MCPNAVLYSLLDEFETWTYCTTGYVCLYGVCMGAGSVDGYVPTLIWLDEFETWIYCTIEYLYL